MVLSTGALCFRVSGAVLSRRMPRPSQIRTSTYEPRSEFAVCGECATLSHDSDVALTMNGRSDFLVRPQRSHRRRGVVGKHNQTAMCTGFPIHFSRLDAPALIPFAIEHPAYRTISPGRRTPCCLVVSLKIASLAPQTQSAYRLHYFFCREPMLQRRFVLIIERRGRDRYQRCPTVGREGKITKGPCRELD